MRCENEPTWRKRQRAHSERWRRVRSERSPNNGSALESTRPACSQQLARGGNAAMASHTPDSPDSPERLRASRLSQYALVLSLLSGTLALLIGSAIWVFTLADEAGKAHGLPPRLTVLP